MITFRLRRPPTINLNWWPATQRQWAPVLLEMQKPFWKEERNPTTSQPWARLSPGYQKWKEKAFPGQPILRATGRMQDTSKIRPYQRGFNVNTTSYGGYHQFGTSKMPARPWMGIPPASLGRLADIAFRNIFFSRNRRN